MSRKRETKRECKKKWFDGSLKHFHRFGGFRASAKNHITCVFIAESLMYKICRYHPQLDNRDGQTRAGQ